VLLSLNNYICIIQYGLFALDEASSEGLTDIVRELIKAGANVNLSTQVS